MKKSKIAWLRRATLLLVIAVTVCGLLLGMWTERAGQTDITVPPQQRHVTMLDRPRPEFRIERLLNLDDANRFDPDVLGKRERARERQRGMANANAINYERVASVSHDQKGVDDQ